MHSYVIQAMSEELNKRHYFCQSVLAPQCYWSPLPEQATQYLDEKEARSCFQNLRQDLTQARKLNPTQCPVFKMALGSQEHHLTLILVKLSKSPAPDRATETSVLDVAFIDQA